MYLNNYGGIPNAAGPAYNGAPPPGSQNPHQQPGQAPPNQQMMYNPQQFPMNPQAAGPGGFPGAHGMMPGNPPPGMMQNPAMPHMNAANGQMPNYQAPYGNAQYNAMAGAQMNVPPNYAMGGGMPMGNFPMGPGMTPQQQQQQQMMQRMQPSHPGAGGMPTPTGQRSFSNQQPQGTPTPGGPGHQQPQFPGQQPGPGTPQNHAQNNAQQSQAPPSQQPQSQHQHQQQQHQQQHQHQQHQNQHQQQQQQHHQQQQQQQAQQHQQQAQPPQLQQQQQPPALPNNATSNNNHNSNQITTPQTPTFTSSGQGNTNGSSASTPLSPGGDSRDKERVQTILDINNELLFEAMQLQHTQQVLKKERTEGSNGTASETLKGEEEQLGQDYIHCMRRLQTNLSYLAALADKKSQGQAAPSPAHLKPPPLHTQIKLRQMQGPDSGADGADKAEPADREETSKYLHELYKKLQDLYPGIDPNKEPPFPAAGARPGMQGPNVAKPGSQTPGQASPVPGNTKTPKMANSGPPQTTPNVAI